MKELRTEIELQASPEKVWQWTNTRRESVHLPFYWEGGNRRSYGEQCPLAVEPDAVIPLDEYYNSRL